MGRSLSRRVALDAHCRGIGEVRPLKGDVMSNKKIWFITGASRGLAAGFEFVSAYAASKFGLEGWMESLQAEVAPFGITTTIVNPGFFRTELLTEQSTNYAEPSIEDYDERRANQLEFWKAQNGKQ